MEPSETERGKLWLSNFKVHEQPAAKRLLDNLDFVGQDELRNSLTRFVVKLSRQISGPIALVPVRETAPGQSYYAHDRNAAPRLLQSGSFPGSEAIVANIITNLRRRDGNRGTFVASPSLANMRNARCRTILLMDDYSGSGTRLLSFLSSFRQHRTIRSWGSYKLLTFMVATYATTEVSYKVLVANLGKANVHTVRVASTFTEQDWSEDEHEAVIQLCRNHMDAATKYPFGFLDTRGMTVFSHSVPNNIPYILRRRSSGSWKGFFEGEVVPDDILPLFSQPKRALRLEAALSRMGQEKLQTGHWKLIAGPFLKETVLVLAAVAHRARDVHAVCNATSLSTDDVNHIVLRCREWGLIDRLSLRLTDTGRTELGHAKKMGLDTTRILLNGSDEFYYPQQLRVGR